MQNSVVLGKSKPPLEIVTCLAHYRESCLEIMINKQKQEAWKSRKVHAKNFKDWIVSSKSCFSLISFGSTEAFQLAKRPRWSDCCSFCLSRLAWGNLSLAAQGWIRFLKLEDPVVNNHKHERWMSQGANRQEPFCFGGFFVGVVEDSLPLMQSERKLPTGISLVCQVTSCTVRELCLYWEPGSQSSPDAGKQIIPG